MNKRNINLVLLEADDSSAKTIESMLSENKQVTFLITHVTEFDRVSMILKEDSYDVLVSDLDFSNTKADDTINRLIDLKLDIPLIIFTTSQYEHLVLRAIQKGIQDFHIKGKVTSTTLHNSILYALERKRIADEVEKQNVKLQTNNQQLAQRVLNDPLTDLPNKQGLQRTFVSQNIWDHLESSDLLAMLINIENMRHINETFGQVEGDKFLKEIAIKIKAVNRPQDMLSRIGGVEFMIFLPNTSPDDGLRIAEKIRNVLTESSITIGNRVAKVSLRIAVVKVNPEIASINRVLTKTQNILSIHRQDKANKIFYEWNPRSRSQSSTKELADILIALRRGDQFQAVKQPIFKLADESIIGYEFFIRSSVKLFENPEDFFRLCMSANILPLVDHQCLKTCIGSSTELAATCRIHLNVFPVTLKEVAIERLLNLFPDEKTLEHFCIELSAQQIIDEPTYLMGAIKMLKSAGIKIAIDDVGFGQSNLESNIVLEPDILKIDPKIITGISRDAQRKEQLQRLLDMFKGIDVDVVVEGVETKDDLYILKKMGVIYGQGYLWGKPE